VKRIVENYHQGKIFVAESRVDVGTTFRVLLPTE
jgi:signal transduction histidine kinase